MQRGSRAETARRKSLDGGGANETMSRRRKTTQPGEDANEDAAATFLCSSCFDQLREKSFALIA